MRRTALATILCVSAAFAAAPPGGAPRCNEAGTQQEMTACAYDAFKKSDRKLNETWQALLWKERGDSNYIEKLREAQKAWMAFRDAEVAARFACEQQDMQRCWGSMYGTSLNYFKKKLTDERQARLQEMLEKGRETT
jgi:uncharacterized protein YecT (DUF1311 family)